MLAVQLPPEFEAHLTDLAQAAGQTESDYVRDLLLEYLCDLQAERVAELRLGDLREGRSRAFTLDDVERDLGLAD